MGIKAGSGGYAGGSGRKGRAKRERFEPRVPQKKPLKPTEKNPFPSDPEFRFGVFKIEEVKDDYLVCKGFDPRAKFPFTEFTPASFAKVEIAKPPLLQRTPWDGETVTIDGIEYTYEYTDANNRTKSWTDDDDEDQEEDEEINIPYFDDDILVAVEVRKNQVVDGFKVNDTKVRNSNDALLSWVDINASGRCWVGPSSGCDAQNAIHDYTIIGSPTGGVISIQLTVLGEQSSLTFNVDDSASDVRTELLTHNKIGDLDVFVSGGPFPDSTIRVEFIKELSNTPVSLPTASWSGASGGEGVAVICAMAQLGSE